MRSSSGRNGDSEERRRAQPVGSMIGVGIAIGSGFGVALGLAFDNLALGIAIGSATGVAVGAAMEQNRRGTAAETHGIGRTWLWVPVGVGLALFGLVVLAGFLLLR